MFYLLQDRVLFKHFTSYLLYDRYKSCDKQPAFDRQAVDSEVDPDHTKTLRNCLLTSERSTHLPRF